MKTIKCAILGFGRRGVGYAEYLQKEENVEFVGIIDPNSFVLQDAKRMLGLSEDKLFFSLDDFLAKKPECDFIYNATLESYKEDSDELFVFSDDSDEPKISVTCKEIYLDILE